MLEENGSTIEREMDEVRSSIDRLKRQVIGATIALLATAAPGLGLVSCAVLGR